MARLELVIEKDQLELVIEKDRLELVMNRRLEYALPILPGGQFAGCSKPIEGCISDRQLLLASGLIPEIDEGDHFLLDRGFGNCEHIFAAKMARAIYPSYKPKDGAPFSIKECVRSEAIARARIHIGMY